MPANAQRSPMSGLAVGSTIITLLMVALLGGSSEVLGQEADILSVSDPVEVNPYLTTRTLIFESGSRLEAASIASPPEPPRGYELERELDALSASDVRALSASAEAVEVLSVPAFDWVFGCSSVSGAMIAGYHDRNGYPNIYTGPTNDGVTPLDNSMWGTWSDGDSIYPNIPLAASHAGVDGRASRGSLDDYWNEYGSTASDPYLTQGWTQHAWGDAVGDYMKTSQSAYGNSDGATTFYSWSGASALPLTCGDMETHGISSRDGTYGRKLFYEARGYTVTDCYNKKTDNVVSGGFSFEDFKAEIDAGQPVMLNLEGHTIVGVGYDDVSDLIYIHDTWDHRTHTMPWGGSYVGMKLLSVSIVDLEPSPDLDDYTVSASAGTGGSITPVSQTAAHGSTVTLTVKPNSGYSIASVGGCFEGSLDGSVYTTGLIVGDCTVIATFSPSYKLTVAKTGSGTVAGPGIDCGSDCTESFARGSKVTLTATPANGYRFARWGGVCSGTGVCVIEMTAARRVSATFRRK